MHALTTNYTEEESTRSFIYYGAILFGAYFVMKSVAKNRSTKKTIAKLQNEVQDLKDKFKDDALNA